jgi:hypothetical protein
MFITFFSLALLARLGTVHHIFLTAYTRAYIQDIPGSGSSGIDTKFLDGSSVVAVVQDGAIILEKATTKIIISVSFPLSVYLGSKRI